MHFFIPGVDGENNTLTSKAFFGQDKMEKHFDTTT